MRKKLKELSEKLNYQVAYLTENPINAGDNDGMKYFLCFQNTHTIIRAWKTEREAIEDMEQIINEEFIYGDNGNMFRVVV